MPLSEDEQRILHQIEQQFYESDPDFAHQVSTSGIERHASRDLKLGVLGVAAGLTLLVVTLPVNVVFAFVGFLVMLGSLVVIDRSARRLGRNGLRRIADRFGAARLLDRFGGEPQRRRRDD